MIFVIFEFFLTRGSPWKLVPFQKIGPKSQKKWYILFVFSNIYIYLKIGDFWIGFFPGYGGPNSSRIWFSTKKKLTREKFRIFKVKIPDFTAKLRFRHVFWRYFGLYIWAYSDYENGSRGQNSICTDCFFCFSKIFQ